MNKILGVIFLALCACYFLIATLPSDYEIEQQLRARVCDRAGGGMPGMITGYLVANQYTIHIDNHLLYKQIYAYDGTYIGTAIAGKTFVK